VPSIDNRLSKKSACPRTVLREDMGLLFGILVRQEDSLIPRGITLAPGDFP
jgi:hypothetical protein